MAATRGAEAEGVAQPHPQRPEAVHAADVRAHRVLDLLAVAAAQARE